MKITPASLLTFSFSHHRPLRSIRAKIMALCLTLILMFSSCTPHEGHSGINPKDIELVATLLGVTAEIGALLLVKNKFMATIVGSAAGAGASYFVREMGLDCKACGNISKYTEYKTADGEPEKVTCNHCQREAYLVATQLKDQFDSIVQRARANLPPTCMLTKEVGSDGEVNLRWQSYNASQASLNGESVLPNGSKTVYPETTTNYVFRVISPRGESQDSVSVEIAQEVYEEEVTEDTEEETQEVYEEEEPVSSPPLPPPAPPSPPPTQPVPEYYAERVSMKLDSILVHEDGSLNATDWIFHVFIDDRLSFTVGKRSYHDDDKRFVRMNSMPTEFIARKNEVKLFVRGYNFDDGKTAEGTGYISVDRLAGYTGKEITVIVPGDPKKGYFSFSFTIEK